jgi:hypothetical protein
MMEPTLKPLPDPQVCRTRFLGQALGLSECLVKSPSHCPYVSQIENSFFCCHPDCRKFERPPQTPNELR